MQTDPPEVRDVETQAPECYLSTPLRRIPPIYKVDPGAWGIIMRFLATGHITPEPGWETVWLCNIYGLVRWEPRPVLRMVVIPYIRNTRRDFIDQVMACRARIWKEVGWLYKKFAMTCRELVRLQWQEYTQTEEWGANMTPETHEWQYYGRVLNWKGIVERNSRKDRLKQLAYGFEYWNMQRSQVLEPNPWDIEVIWPLDEGTSWDWLMTTGPYSQGPGGPTMQWD